MQNINSAKVSDKNEFIWMNLLAGNYMHIQVALWFDKFD